MARRAGETIEVARIVSTGQDCDCRSAGRGRSDRAASDEESRSLEFGATEGTKIGAMRERHRNFSFRSGLTRKPWIFSWLEVKTTNRSLRRIACASTS